MPQKALVAFGVAFGLLTLSVPSWSSEAKDSVNEKSNSADAIPITGKESEMDPALPVLTEEDVTTLVLEKSPALAAFSKEITAREFETLQNGLRPNPKLSVEVENVAGTGEFSGTDAAETTARISQLLELGDKRKRRRAVGRLEEEVAERIRDCPGRCPCRDRKALRCGPCRAEEGGLCRGAARPHPQGAANPSGNPSP